MAKPVKYYKMGEVMEATKLSRQTIHNYTVAGLISEAKRTPKGHRLYNEDVFDRLEKIKILQNKNYTLSQIKKLLSVS
ncbi:MAG: MerR family transcriptional regulator [Candidatus Omnitrophica bacterium]|nr:MerR family transcriptional regulator [Candidatus Omnitrophota bacterium]